MNIVKMTGLAFGIGAGYAVVAEGLGAFGEFWGDAEIEYEEYLVARKNHTGYNENPIDPKGRNMNIAKKSLISAKNFVVRHKTAIAVATTAVVTATVVKKLNDGAYETAMTFIGEKDLMGEFEHFLLDETEI